VHFLVRGEPALGVAGRKRKQPKDPAPPPAHDPAPAIVPPASGGKEVRSFPSCPDLFYPPLVVSLLLPFARRRQTDLRAPSRVPARTCPPFRMVPEPLRSHTRSRRRFVPLQQAPPPPPSPRPPPPRPTATSPPASRRTPPSHLTTKAAAA
jgi:hypothetical protein